MRIMQRTKPPFNCTQNGCLYGFHVTVTSHENALYCRNSHSAWEQEHIMDSATGIALTSQNHVTKYSRKAKKHRV